MTNLKEDNIDEYSNIFFDDEFDSKLEEELDNQYECEECDEIIEIVEYDDLKELEKLVKNLKVDLESVKGSKNKVDDLEVKNKFLDEENLFLKARLKKLDQTIKLDENNRNVSELKEKIIDLEKINFDKEKDINILKDEKFNLLNKIEKLIEENDSLIKSNTEFKKEFLPNEEQIEYLKKQNNIVSKNLDEISCENISLITRIEELNKNIFEKEILNENLQIEKQKLIEEKDMYISEIKTLKLKNKFKTFQLVERSVSIETIYIKIDSFFSKIILNEPFVSDNIKNKMNQVIKNIIVLRKFYAGIQSDIGHEKICIDSIGGLKKIVEEFKGYDTDIDEIFADFKALKFEGENFKWI